jgi:hypothetical protein
MGKSSILVKLYNVLIEASKQKIKINISEKINNLKQPVRKGVMFSQWCASNILNKINDKRINIGSAEKPCTGPYSKPDESSPYLPILFLQD